MAIYDINGNVVSSGESATSDFGVTAYELFTDNDNVSARQGILTYQGKRFYPYNYPEQRTQVIKMYGGKIGLFIGDSYTAMGSSYVTAFCERRGLIADNQGLASSTIAGSEDKITVGYHAFWVRLNEVLEEYRNGKEIDGMIYYLSDIAFVHFMGGANDWYTVDESQGIDRLGDITSENKEQLYGACKYIFSTLLTECPKADIVVTLQPTNVNGDNNNYAMALKESIVRECAEMFGLPINDCRFKWFNATNPEDLAKYWQTDNLHLSNDGNNRLWNVDLENTVNNLTFSRVD